MALGEDTTTPTQKTRLEAGEKVKIADEFDFVFVRKKFAEEYWFSVYHRNSDSYMSDRYATKGAALREMLSVPSFIRWVVMEARSKACKQTGIFQSPRELVIEGLVVYAVF